MIITVKTFEDKSTSKGLWYLVTDQEGKNHNIFESKCPNLGEKLPLLTPGLTVELTKVKTDKGWDTTDIKSSGAKEAVQSDQSAKYATNNQRNQSIEEQVAVKAITELEIAGSPVSKELLDARDKWLYKTLNVEPPLFATEAPKTDMKPVEATKSPEVVETTVKPQQGTTTPMKDWNDFSAGFKGLGLVWPDVHKLLGTKGIDDIKATYKNPATAYGTLLLKHSQEIHGAK
jgi:hypothetical protein